MKNSQESQPARLLLVERDEASARVLIAKLSGDGHKVTHATDEGEALSSAVASPPDVILFASSTSADERLAFVTRVRSVDALVALPLLVLSHDLSDTELVRAMERGASDFIIRPFHIAELRARVRSGIRTSQLIKLLEHRARIDSLTGLWNRLYFTERLDSAIAASGRSGEPLSVVILDIDHFKQINDGHGHAAGDAVLQHFAAVLRKSVRAGDTPCRYGGEEFAVILPGATAAHAAQFCERFRSLLAASRWPAPLTRPVTASCGITTVGLNNEAHLQAWVEAADRALYAAKQAGRDRAHIFEPETGVCPPVLRRAG